MDRPPTTSPGEIAVFGTVNGGREISEAINRSPASVGFESQNQPPPDAIPVEFVDYPFTRDAPSFEDHLEAVKQHRPAVTVAPDVEKGRGLAGVLEQADQLAEYADHVVVVPKEVHPGDVPGGYRVGIPCANYGSDAPHEFHEYVEAESVHLLGGSPTLHRQLSKTVIPVASVDTASILTGAENYQVWTWPGLYSRAAYQDANGTDLYDRITACYTNIHEALNTWNLAEYLPPEIVEKDPANRDYETAAMLTGRGPPPCQVPGCSLPSELVEDTETYVAEAQGRNYCADHLEGMRWANEKNAEISEGADRVEEQVEEIAQPEQNAAMPDGGDPTGGTSYMDLDKPTRDAATSGHSLKKEWKKAEKNSKVWVDGHGPFYVTSITYPSDVTSKPPRTIKFAEDEDARADEYTGLITRTGSSFSWNIEAEEHGADLGSPYDEGRSFKIESLLVSNEHQLPEEIAAPTYEWLKKAKDKLVLYTEDPDSRTFEIARVTGWGDGEITVESGSGYGGTETITVDSKENWANMATVLADYSEPEAFTVTPVGVVEEGMEWTDAAVVSREAALDSDLDLVADLSPLTEKDPRGDGGMFEGVEIDGSGIDRDSPITEITGIGDSAELLHDLGFETVGEWWDHGAPFMGISPQYANRALRDLLGADFVDETDSTTLMRAFLGYTNGAVFDGEGERLGGMPSALFGSLDFDSARWAWMLSHYHQSQDDVYRTSLMDQQKVGSDKKSPQYALATGDDLPRDLLTMDPEDDTDETGAAYSGLSGLHPVASTATSLKTGGDNRVRFTAGGDAPDGTDALAFKDTVEFFSTLFGVDYTQDSVAQEYVEIVGAPGKSDDRLYIVVFEHPTSDTYALIEGKAIFEPSDFNLAGATYDPVQEWAEAEAEAIHERRDTSVADALAAGPESLGETLGSLTQPIYKTSDGDMIHPDDEPGKSVEAELSEAGLDGSIYDPTEDLADDTSSGMFTPLSVGTRVRHPEHGEGRIARVTAGGHYVNFGDGEGRRVDHEQLVPVEDDGDDSEAQIGEWERTINTTGSVHYKAGGITAKLTSTTSGYQVIATTGMRQHDIEISEGRAEAEDLLVSWVRDHSPDEAEALIESDETPDDPAPEPDDDPEPENASDDLVATGLGRQKADQLLDLFHGPDALEEVAITTPGEIEDLDGFGEKSVAKVKRWATNRQQSRQIGLIEEAREAGVPDEVLDSPHTSEQTLRDEIEKARTDGGPDARQASDKIVTEENMQTLAAEIEAAPKGMKLDKYIEGIEAMHEQLDLDGEALELAASRLADRAFDADREIAVRGSVEAAVGRADTATPEDDDGDDLDLSETHGRHERVEPESGEIARWVNPDDHAVYVSKDSTVPEGRAYTVHSDRGAIKESVAPDEVDEWAGKLAGRADVQADDADEAAGGPLPPVEGWEVDERTATGPKTAHAPENASATQLSVYESGDGWRVEVRGYYPGLGKASSERMTVEDVDYPGVGRPPVGGPTPWSETEAITVAEWYMENASAFRLNGKGREEVEATEADRPAEQFAGATVALVGCGKAKKDGRHPAQYLYTSTYFELKRGYSKEEADDWFILSAEHGLIEPEEEIDNYDTVISDVDPDEWAQRVISQADFSEADEVLIFAGSGYSDPLLAHAPDSWNIRMPTEGMMIGERMAWLKERTTNETSKEAARRNAASRNNANAAAGRTTHPVAQGLDRDDPENPALYERQVSIENKVNDDPEEVEIEGWRLDTVRKPLGILWTDGEGGTVEVRNMAGEKTAYAGDEQLTEATDLDTAVEVAVAYMRSNPAPLPDRTPASTLDATPAEISEGDRVEVREHTDATDSEGEVWGTVTDRTDETIRVQVAPGQNSRAVVDFSEGRVWTEDGNGKRTNEGDLVEIEVVETDGGTAAATGDTPSHANGSPLALGDLDGVGDATVEKIEDATGINDVSALDSAHEQRHQSDEWDTALGHAPTTKARKSMLRAVGADPSKTVAEETAERAAKSQESTDGSQSNPSDSDDSGVTWQAKKFLGGAWGRYKAMLKEGREAREEMAEYAEVREDGQEAAAQINEVRRSFGQEPIDFEGVEEIEGAPEVGGEVMPEDVGSSFSWRADPYDPTQEGGE